MKEKLKKWEGELHWYYFRFRKEVLKLCFAVVVAEYIIAGGYFMAEHKGWLEFLKPRTVILNVARAEVKEVVPVKEDTTPEIADKIYHLESSSGKKNYSKCEAIGKVNSIGFNIPGNGKYVCFDNHSQEMKALRKWVDEHKQEGLTVGQLLCHYNIGSDKEGKIPNDCPYFQDYLTID